MYSASLNLRPPSAKYCFKQFPNTNSFNHFNNPMRCMLLASIVQMKKRRLKRGKNHLPRVTPLTKGRARTGTQASLAPEFMLCMVTLVSFHSLI